MGFLFIYYDNAPPELNVMPGLTRHLSQKELSEKDTESLNQVQGRQARCDSTFGNVDFVY